MVFTALICIRWIRPENKSHIMILVALITISIITTKFVWLPWSVQAGISASGYVLIGFISRGKVKCDKIWIAVFGLALYVLELITDTSVSVASNNYGIY